MPCSFASGASLQLFSHPARCNSPGSHCFCNIEHVFMFFRKILFSPPILSNFTIWIFTPALCTFTYFLKPVMDVQFFATLLILFVFLHCLLNSGGISNPWRLRRPPRTLSPGDPWLSCDTLSLSPPGTLPSLLSLCPPCGGSQSSPLLVRRPKSGHHLPEIYYGSTCRFFDWTWHKLQWLNPHLTR